MFFFIFRNGIVGRKLVNEMSDVRFQQLDMFFFHQFGSTKTWWHHHSTFFGVHLGGIFTVCFFWMGTTQLSRKLVDAPWKMIHFDPFRSSVLCSDRGPKKMKLGNITCPQYFYKLIIYLQHLGTRKAATSTAHISPLKASEEPSCKIEPFPFPLPPPPLTKTGFS